MRKILKNRIILAVMFFLIMSLIAVVTFNKINNYKPFENDNSSVILDRNGNILRVFLNSKEQWKINRNDKIPDKLVKSVIYFEDKKFFKHHGVNYLALIRATFQNITKMKKFSGASTITMQVARLSKPKKRTIPNKIKEIFTAYILEIKYSKEEILKMYFNNAPYGSNIKGYQAAALKYFGKEARDLSWAESATLAILPNSPGLISPVYGRESLIKKRNLLLKNLCEEKIIDEETYKLSLLEKVPDKKYPFPLSAPHFTRYIERKYKGEIVNTTIDKNIQYDVNEIVKSHINLLKAENVNNISAIVMDTKTGEVISYIGSQNFFDNSSFGKIDGVRIKRSTGSLLKPFLYGLAIDKGMICSETMLEDVPKYFGAYSPQNYYRDYKGLVSAKDALISSLNIPAVGLLDQYGIYDFYSFLKDSGMTTLRNNAKSYGLPLILGGAEGKLIELVNMYRMLGNYGEWSNVKFTLDQKNNEAKKNLLSKGASYLVLDMLKDVKRPGTEFFNSYFSNKWPIAWKTGTSFGGRDAWAIGVSPKWTVGVWTGNFSGTGVKTISGVKTAAPILFNIFNYLPKNKFDPWFKKPKNSLRKEKIYKDTGYKVLVTDKNYDKTKVMEIEIPKDSPPLKQDIYRKKIFTTKNGKEQVCSLCWESGNYVEKIIPIFPPDVSEYLMKSGRSYASLPPHKKDCPSLDHQTKIDFIYPKSGTHILVPKDFEGEFQKIRVLVGTNMQDSTLYWYLNGKYLGKTEKSHEKFISFESGYQEITVQNNSGIKKSIRFYTERRK